eukprot:CAMPEP_0204116412 /NCGR_PEP_ID=MMETSP0361-20130328/5392_1 /ASSEMBLY_ACC=CAM_ASM_000343 /TAXON_ID=268821 /ORGANISM="Scrippsiella Hangoei, Strain SHTV-5" /LENGTH=239 /DNA_ID=CAMNT_0051067201 /DNA_START=164 /DNA_END=880 /DNA_ORIENTATION=+
MSESFQSDLAQVIQKPYHWTTKSQAGLDQRAEKSGGTSEHGALQPIAVQRMEAMERVPFEKAPKEFLLLLQASSVFVSDIFNLAAPARDEVRTILDQVLHIPRAENLRAHIPLSFEDLPEGRVREARGRPARKIDDHRPCDAVLQLPEEGCGRAPGVVHKHKPVTKRQCCHYLCEIFQKVDRSSRGENVLAQAPETQAPTFHLECSGKPARDAAQAFVITRAGAEFWEADEEHVPTDRL